MVPSEGLLRQLDHARCLPQGDPALQSVDVVEEPGAGRIHQLGVVLDLEQGQSQSALVGVGVAWTNIEGEESTFSDGFVVWGFVNVGFDK